MQEGYNSLPNRQTAVSFAVPFVNDHNMAVVAFKRGPDRKKSMNKNRKDEIYFECFMEKQSDTK